MISRRSLGLFTVGALSGVGLVACLPPPPPPAPAACQSVGAASTTSGRAEPAQQPSSQPIPPDQAAAQARQVSSTTDVRTKDGDIPIVTVENQGGKPVIQSTPVKTPDQAAAVAQDKASNGDLVAVDVDKPVRSLSFSNPTDPSFGQQWSFNEVPYVKAWNTDNTQGAGTTVAVVDTGVQANHPDLSGQVLSGEYFLHSNNGNTAFSGVGGTTDPDGHGTHVSGTIAALSSNGIGVSGAAPAAQILPVEVLCGNGTGFSSDVASGITWAVDHGAKVVNLSLGGGANSAEQAAVQYADAHNVVVVAAGGNDGQSGNTPSYPAAYSTSQGNVIAVAATTNANPPAHASYSTVASYIDISAPGGLPTSNDASVSVLSTWNDGGYRAIAGTSMATPHVSAAAALLIAAANCTDSQVKTRLKATANTTLTPTNGAGPFAQQFGAGIVDPNAAAATC
jgi:serine protease